MLRVSSRPLIVSLALASGFLFDASESSAVDVPQFERFSDPSSIQPPSGWTLVNQEGVPTVFGSILTHESIGGNPIEGGFAKFQDFADDASFVAAPSTYLGNWSSLDNKGSIIFDHQIIAFDGILFPNSIRLKSSQGDEARWYSAQLAATGGWHLVEANLVENEWTMISGSWNSLLQDVTEFRIGIEVVDGLDTTGIDNIEFFPNVAYASFLRETATFDVIGTGRCSNAPLQICDPDPGAPNSCGEGASCDPRAPETPAYSWTDCPECGSSVDPANPQAPLVYDTRLGQCRFEQLQTTHLSGLDQVSVEVGLIAYRNSGYMCCEWLTDCVDCSSGGGAPGSFSGKSPLFRWGTYADRPPGPDTNLNGRPDDCEDPDNDGTPTLLDNCPTANVSQIDSDKDGIGDACDVFCNPHLSNNCVVPEPGLPVMLATAVVALFAAGRRRASLRSTAHSLPFI